MPKLLDFGIAKILEADRPSETTLFRMITPDSASPEQIRGEPVTTSTDVYALGVLLYRLLTKRSPYRLTSTSETELIQAICDQQPTPPSAIVPAIDPDLDHVVLTALRKEPERRYTGADGLSDDLQRYLEGRPVSATPDSRLYRARKFVARHRVGVAAVAALVLTVLIGSMSTLWQARVAERERARAERQFLAVRTLATSVLGELHDAVNGLAGSTGARELLLRRATEYLDGLSREAGQDAALRRELADGYRRLAQVQGTSGMSNVGDRQAAITSYRKALAVLQPLADATGEPGDRLRLAGTYVSLAGLERDRDTRTTLNRQALALLEGLPPDARETPEAVNARVRVWHAIGRLELDGKQYANAKVSFENEVAAAEAAIKLSPDSATAIRNLSLAQQQLGTTLEMLGRVDDAIACYRRALALDQERVQRLGGTADARLDLSFSYGAVGTALLTKGDVAGAREHYRQAIELRQAVLLEDPENDWARKGLALGAQRMAFVQGRGGDLEDAVQWLERGLEIFRQRAAAHPERDRPWVDLATAIFESATEGVLWLEAPAVPPGTRLRVARQLDGLLEDLAQLRARWARERRATALPPPDDDLQRLRERVRRLLPTSASRTAP